MSSFPSNERIIPIEVLGETLATPTAPVNAFNAQVLADRLSGLNASLNRFDSDSSASRGSGGRSSQRNSVNGESGSKRASLIITHSDGSTEENAGFVTSLGISDIVMDRGCQGSGVNIQEIGHETLLRELGQNKLQVILPEASNIIVEELMESSDFSETSSNGPEDESETSEPTTVIADIGETPKDRPSNPLSLAVSGSSWSPTISSPQLSPSPPVTPTIKSLTQSIPIVIENVSKISASPSPKSPRPTFRPSPPVSTISFRPPPSFQDQENFKTSDSKNPTNPLSLDISGSSWSPTISSLETSPSISPKISTLPLTSGPSRESPHCSKVPPITHPSLTPPPSLSAPNPPLTGVQQPLNVPPPVQCHNYEHSALAAEPPATLRSVICSVAEGRVTQENTSYTSRNQTVECRKQAEKEKSYTSPILIQQSQTSQDKEKLPNNNDNSSSNIAEHSLFTKKETIGESVKQDETKCSKSTTKFVTQPEIINPELCNPSHKSQQIPIQSQTIPVSLAPGPVEIPIQREKLIDSKTKISSGQPRHIAIGVKRHSLPERIPPSLLGKGTLSDQSPHEPKFRKENKMLSEPTGEGIAQHVRIVPISLPDDETQEIRVEFSETNSRQEADKKGSEDHSGEKQKEERDGYKENKEHRVIPIQLASGETVMPTFTKLEESEPPVWSVFRPIGNEKERLVPIKIDEPTVKAPSENANSNQYKPTSVTTATTANTQQRDTTASTQQRDTTANTQQRDTTVNTQQREQKTPSNTNTDGLDVTLETQAKKRHVSGPANTERTKLTKEEQAEVRNTLDRVHQELETAKGRLASQVAHISAGSSPVTLPRVQRPTDIGTTPGTTYSRPVQTPTEKETNQGNTSFGPLHRPIEIGGATSGSPFFRPGHRSTEIHPSSSSRSKSLDTKHRSSPPRNGTKPGSCQLGKERSMEEINKDIEMIWKELQELDSLPTSRPASRNDISSDKMQSNKWSERTRSPSATPLSEQKSCSPWRTKTPPPYKDPPSPSSRQSRSPLPSSAQLRASRPLSSSTVIGASRQSTSPVPASSINLCKSRQSASPIPASSLNLGTSKQSTSPTPASSVNLDTSRQSTSPIPASSINLGTPRQNTPPIPASSIKLGTSRQSTSPIPASSINLGTSRQSTSPLPPSTENISASPKTEPTKARTTIWDLPSVSQPKSWKEHSSYASPNSKRPALFPSTPVNINSQGTFDPLMSSCWDNKPQYNPVTTGHYSFHTNTSPTKPGSITPAYVSTSPRLSSRSNTGSNTMPNVKTRSASSNPGINRVPIVQTGLPFPKEGNNAAGQSESQPNLKSCLKTDNKEPKTRFIRTRSESPAGRDSPSKLNVNFKPDTTFYTTKNTSGGESTYDKVNSYKTNGEKRGNICSATINGNDGMKEALSDSNVGAATLTGVREVPIQKENITRISAINKNGLPTKGTRHVPILLEERLTTPSLQSNGISQAPLPPGKKINVLLQQESPTSCPIQPKNNINVPIQPEKMIKVPLQPETPQSVPIQPTNNINVLIQPERKIKVPWQPEKRTNVSVKPDKNINVPKQPWKKINMSMQTEKDTAVPIHQSSHLPKQEDRGTEQPHDQSPQIPIRTRTGSQNRYGKETKQNNRKSDPGPSNSGTSSPLTTDEACYACDACTQTPDDQHKDKKGACILM